jgi:2'-5' RNA ligase
MKVIRAFIAFELPDDILKCIGETQRQLKKRGLKFRWVPHKNIHLTLKFIGDLSVEQIERVANTLADSAEEYGPMTFHASGLGVFPGLSRPRILWVGIDGDIDLLTRFQKTLDGKLDIIGIKSEKRPFKGHLTIGRGKKRLDMKILKESLRDFYDFQTRPFVINEVKLFQSELKSTGAVYTCLKNIVFFKKKVP